MPRRPRPNRPQAELAAARITTQRTTMDDPDLALLPDHLLGIAAHAASHRNIPHAARRTEWADAWTILDWLEDHLDHVRETLIRAGIDAGLSYGRMATLAGMKHRQGMEQLHLRLQRATHPTGRLTKDEKAARAERRTQRDDDQQRHHNAHAIWQIAADLQQHATDGHTSPDITDDITDLIDMCDRCPPGHPTEAIAAQIRGILRDLHADPGNVVMHQYAQQAAAALGLTLQRTTT